MAEEIGMTLHVQVSPKAASIKSTLQQPNLPKTNTQWGQLDAKKAHNSDRNGTRFNVA